MRCFISQVSLIQTRHITMWSEFQNMALNLMPIPTKIHSSAITWGAIEGEHKQRNNSFTPFIFISLCSFIHKFYTVLFLKANPEVSKLNEQKNLLYPFLNQSYPPLPKTLLLTAWGVLCKYKYTYPYHEHICVISVYFYMFFSTLIFWPHEVFYPGQFVWNCFILIQQLDSHQ